MRTEAVTDSQSEGYVPTEKSKEIGQWRAMWDEVKYTFTTRDGLIGDYDYQYLFTPNIWPLNKRYKDHVPPFFFPDDRIPLLLIFILGVQHALTKISGIITPILAISRGAFHLDAETTAYLVSAGFITTAVASFAQITRSRIRGTPYYFGTGVLSVLGPTFDIIPIAIQYSATLYASGECPTGANGTRLPCPDGYGKLIGSALASVWAQLLISFVPPKTLKRIFPSVVTGNLLLVLGIYLVSSAAASWGGGTSCLNGEGIYALCPNVNAPKPLPWGDSRLIGIGFSVFVTILIVEMIGSPLMKSCGIILGLAVGSAISGALGYWSTTQIDQAPVATFLWVTTFKLRVDGALILPLVFMFICEAMVCMPCIIAASEVSGIPTEGLQANQRIQGGILCDSVGTIFSCLGMSLPMVSHAGNNGVILVTSNASRRAGYCACVILVIMGIFGKFGGVFAAMPSTVLGAMQVFLYATIAVSGLRILATIGWSRRDRFILSASLGLGLMDILVPEWFSDVLPPQPNNEQLDGFLRGVNLLVETPFILTMLTAVLLNAIMPRDRSHMKAGLPTLDQGSSGSDGKVESKRKS
ncbi:unnamed protein product [Zymoseptoria tritici ST99CH_1E4]|uniref:Purine permease n=1 Tax=Zymoseptoria tritici ST99CH_1E4 TaxID=1276532 RepID=A0A2H1GAG9_ZYMTR|nr:unnamed protein product [Zymoseptoria tritici ST99CH_1E4]